jgi:hypothetical protein
MIPRPVRTSNVPVGLMVEIPVPAIGFAYLVLAFVLSCYVRTPGPERYTFYAVPLVLWAAHLFETRGVLGVRPLKGALLICLATVIPTLLNVSGGAKYAVFSLTGILVAFVPVYLTRRQVSFLGFVCFGLQLLVWGETGFSLNFGAELTRYTTLAATDILPFVSILFVGFFLLDRQFAKAAMMIAVVPLGDKRIADFALFVAMPYLALSLYTGAAVLRGAASNKARGFVSSLPFRHWSTWYVLPLMITAAVVAISFVWIMTQISYAYGLNVNVFSSGRVVGQRLAVAHLIARPWWEALFGGGLSLADALAAPAWFQQGILLHNDYLRLALNYGILGALAVVCGYWRLFSSTNFGRYVLAINAILWISDNTFIYAVYQVFSVLLLQSSMRFGRAYRPAPKSVHHMQRKRMQPVKMSV